jgi:uncharacterized protein YqhQ
LRCARENSGEEEKEEKEEKEKEKEEAKNTRYFVGIARALILSLQSLFIYI